MPKLVCWYCVQLGFHFLEYRKMFKICLGIFLKKKLASFVNFVKNIPVLTHESS